MSKYFLSIFLLISFFNVFIYSMDTPSVSDELLSEEVSMIFDAFEKPETKKMSKANVLSLEELCFKALHNSKHFENGGLIEYLQYKNVPEFFSKKIVQFFYENSTTRKNDQGFEVPTVSESSKKNNGIREFKRIFHLDCSFFPVEATSLNDYSSSLCSAMMDLDEKRCKSKTNSFFDDIRRSTTFESNFVSCTPIETIRSRNNRFIIIKRSCLFFDTKTTTRYCFVSGHKETKSSNCKTVYYYDLYDLIARKLLIRGKECIFAGLDKSECCVYLLSDNDYHPSLCFMECSPENAQDLIRKEKLAEIAYLKEMEKIEKKAKKGIQKFNRLRRKEVLRVKKEQQLMAHAEGGYEKKYKKTKNIFDSVKRMVPKCFLRKDIADIIEQSDRKINFDTEYHEPSLRVKALIGPDKLKTTG